MKKVIQALFALMLIVSCEKSNRICGCNDPLADLSWLKEMKNSLTNCTCRISIFQATYQNETVFYQLMNDPLCDGVQTIVLFNCQGQSVASFSPLDQASYDGVTGRKQIYTCKTE